MRLAGSRPSGTNQCTVLIQLLFCSKAFWISTLKVSRENYQLALLMSTQVKFSQQLRNLSSLMSSIKQSWPQHLFQASSLLWNLMVICSWMEALFTTPMWSRRLKDVER